MQGVLEDTPKAKSANQIPIQAFYQQKSAPHPLVMLVLNSIVLGTTLASACTIAIKPYTMVCPHFPDQSLFFAYPIFSHAYINVFLNCQSYNTTLLVQFFPVYILSIFFVAWSWDTTISEHGNMGQNPSVAFFSKPKSLVFLGVHPHSIIPELQFDHEKSPPDTVDGPAKSGRHRFVVSTVWFIL